MIFWSLCAFIWFRNMKKMLLQMSSVSLQPVPSLGIVFFNDIRAVNMTVCWHHLLFEFRNFEFSNLTIYFDAAI
jgi:hypothetical protein